MTKFCVRSISLQCFSPLLKIPQFLCLSKHKIHKHKHKIFVCVFVYTKCTLCVYSVFTIKLEFVLSFSTAWFSDLSFGISTKCFRLSRMQLVTLLYHCLDCTPLDIFWNNLSTSIHSKFCIFTINGVLCFQHISSFILTHHLCIWSI